MPGTSSGTAKVHRLRDIPDAACQGAERPPLEKRYLAEDAAGLDTTDSAVRLKAARQSLSDFTKATGGRVDSARVSVPKFGRSEAGRASAKSQAHHTDWLKSINAQSTSLNTVAKYYDARYNNTEEYRLLMQYANSVKVAGFRRLQV